VRQEDREFKASLCYIARPCLKKPKPKEKITWGFTFEVYKIQDGLTDGLQA
jgi:hypothetical protein